MRKTCTWVTAFSWFALTGLAPIAAETMTDFRDAVRTAEPALMTVIVDPDRVVQPAPADQVAADEDAANPQRRGPKIEWFGIDGRPIGAMPDLGRRGFRRSASGDMFTSAFAVDDHLLIAYVGNAVDQVSVRDPRGDEVDGTVLAFDYVTGLAAIRVADASYNALLISSAQTEPGMPIVAAWLDEGILVTDAGMIATRPVADGSGVGAAPRIDFGGGTQMIGAAVVNADGMLVGTLVPNQNGQLVCVQAAEVRRLVDAATADPPHDLKRGLVGIQFEGGGALIAEVSPDSAAAQAGIQAGDLVTRVGNLQIDSASEVVAAVANARAGDTLEITVKRGGETQTLSVTLGEHPQQRLAASGASTPGFAMQRAFELKDGKLVPMEIAPGQLPPLDDGFPRDLLRRFQQPGGPIWQIPELEGAPELGGPVDGFEVERSDVEETLKELQRQMEQLNKKLDR